MREVPAVRKIQAEDGVPGLQHSGVRLHVRRRTGVRLHVGVFRAEELFRSLTCQVLDDVGVLATAIIALARIPLGILVREHRTHGFEHGFAYEILRGDQL